VIDIIDVHELMKEFVLLRGSRTLCSDRFSFIKTTVCVYDETGFYNVSGYYFLILKFAVVPLMGRCQKVGVQKLVSGVQLLHEPIF